ncbi:hypothetical protein H0H93_011175 [Arthromyces matolae]|nr:hypothetical protein H0H93_011175 [Arthromyces matolae]
MRKRPDPVLFEKDYEDRHVMNVVELIAFANFGAADPQSSFLEDLKFGEQLYYLLPYVKQVVDALKIRVPKTPKRFRIPTRPKFEDFETYLTNSLWFLQNGIELAFNARERLHTRDIEAVYAQRDLVRDVKDSLATVRSECRRKKFAKIWEWEDLYHKLVVYAKFLGQMQEDAGNTLDSIQYELEPIIRLLDRELPKIPEGYLKTYLQEGREFLENRRTVPPGYRQSGGPPAYNSSHGAGVAHSPQVPPP